jgi:DNA-binding response OmpR family regulator
MNNLELLKKINLLYIEDEDSQRESVSKTLKLIVNNLFVAKDGIEGLEIFRKENIQVVMTDYVMPNLDGYETAKAIREISSNIPIIISSAFSEKEKLLNAIDIKVIDYIEKPLNEVKIIHSLLLAYSKLQQCNLLEVQIKENIKYSFLTEEFYINNSVIALTKREKSIIELLLKNKGKLVSKDMFINSIFHDLIEDGAVRNTLYKLRKKIGNDIIETILDIGYMIK